MEQQMIDLLYNALYVQHIRHYHFQSTKTQGQWNSKAQDETAIFKQFLEEYKTFFYTKIKEITKLVTDLKEYNINSYLTRDPDYYITLFNYQISNIKKYSDLVDNLTIDNVLVTNLTSLGKDLDTFQPNFIPKPTLFGKLVKLPENKNKNEDDDEEE